MATFDEIRKKLNNQYGRTTAAPKANQTQPVEREADDSRHSFSSVRSKLLNRYNENTSAADEISNWARKATYTLDQMSSADPNRYTTSFGGGNMARVQDLIKQYENISERFNQQKNRYENPADVEFSLESLLSGLKDAEAYGLEVNNYYEQWQSEQEYNDYLAYQQEQEELLAFDLAAERVKLDDLGERYNAGGGSGFRGVMRGIADSLGIKTNEVTDPDILGDYSSFDELAKDYTQRTQYYNRAKALQDKTALHDEAVNAPDFFRMATTGKNIENPEYNKADGSFGVGEWRPFAEDIGNIVTYSRENWEKIREAEINGIRTEGKSIYRHMTEDEVSIYNYYLAKEGEAKAGQYLDSIEETLNAREGAGMFNDVLDDRPFLEMVFGVTAGVDQFSTGMRTVTGGGEYEPVSAVQYASQMVREDLNAVGPNLPEILGVDEAGNRTSVGQAAYDLITTTSNMLPSILASTAVGFINPVAGRIVGGVTLGASAAGNAYAEMARLGYSEDQSTAYAAMIGASETILGSLIGGITKLGGFLPKGITETVLKNVDNAMARVAIRLGGNMVSEFTEEYLQEVMSPWYENIAFHADNDIDWFSADALYSGLLGALSAGVLEGGGTIAGEANIAKLGRQLQSNDISAERLAEIGKTFSADTVAHRLANKVNEDTGAYTIGRLFNEIGASLSEQNVAAIEEDLVSKGMSRDNANTHAQIMAYIVEGGTLSDVQMRMIERNDVLAATMRDVIINPNSTVYQRTSSYTDALRALAGEVTGEASPAAQDKAPKQNLEQEATDTPVTKRSLAASESGKTVLASTNEDVRIDRVESVNNGKMTLRLQDGRVVDSTEVSYASDGEALVYETVANMDVNTAAADLLIKAYLPDGNVDAEAYSRGIQEAYRYGMYNIPEAEMSARGAFAKDLTEDQRRIAYKLGQMFGGKSIAKNVAQRSVRTKHSVNDASLPVAAITSSLTERQSVSVKALNSVAKSVGVEFRYFASHERNGRRYYTDANGTEHAAPNGIYITGTGVVYIDLNAGQNGEQTILYTASHELTHFIRDWSEEKFKVLANFLFEQYGKKGVSVDQLVREQIAKAKRNGRDISYDTAYEEVVADSMQTMLNDGKVAERLALLKQQDESLWNKIRDFFRDLAEKIRKVYEGMTPNTKEAELVSQMTDAIERMQELFAEGLAAAGENYQSALTLEENTDVIPVEDTTKFSYRSLAEAAGFEAIENEDGTRSFVRNGVKVSEVTVEDIENSPIGAMINYSLSKNDISKAEAERQKEMFAAVCTMAIKTNDFSMTMQFVGSAVFTGMKANADKQYGTTYDFPSICTKTQAVIDAMSKRMVTLGRGLNSDELVKLYQDVFTSGNPVPCPECYVFSRWIGIGGLLDNIKKYQDYYGKMAVEDVAKAYQAMRDEVSAFAEDQGISFGKAKGALTAKLTKEYVKLTEKIEKAENQGEKVKPADRARLEELEPMMNTVKGMTWLENVYFADSSLKKVNPRFRVPDSVLFDLNNGEAFATQYKEAWAFRTTQGAGYGKAITPYAEARLGEGILVTNNTTNAIKGKAQGTLDNFFLRQRGALDKKSREALDRARLKQKTQAFIGGQRFQSTSDARYENASDYLLAALEMQAMHGMVQVYTKVDGAVPAFSAWNFSINQSLMPLGGGLDSNGNVKDTSVGGMKPKIAFENRKKHETAGTITIGVNDNHIRAMFQQWVRDFIIPYHASGGKVEVVNAFRNIQEGLEKRGKMVRSTDYSRTQSDKILSDEVLRWLGKTEAEIQRIHDVRAARIAILTRGKVNMEVVRANRFLSALYDKLNGGEWDGVKLAKSKVESQIYPNEFWDQTVNYEDSGKVTRDYLEYCDDLGFLHRFSGTVPSNGKLVPVNGYDQNGNRVQLTDLAYKYKNGQKTDQIEDFFWKVLTDRRMYDNDGNYLAQKVVTLNDTTEDTVTGFAKNNYGRQYDKELSMKTAESISNPYYGKSLYMDSEVYDYDFMVSLRPMEINTMPPLSAVKTGNRVDQKKAVRLGLENAANVGREIAKDMYAIKNVYTGREILLGQHGLDHGLEGGDIGRLRTNARLSAIGGQIVQNAVPVNGMKNKNSQAKGTYAMACLLRSGDMYVVAIVTVEEHTSKAIDIDYVDITHAIGGRLRKNKEGSLSSTRETGYGQKSVPTAATFTVSIAEFLNIVNDTHRSILSKDVLEHFNEERPSDGHYTDRVLFSDRYNAPTFYSQMAKVVDGVKQEKLGAASVVNMLRGKGVKAEEIKWSGIEEWLEGKKSVTKAELQEFINGNMLQLEETTRDEHGAVRMNSETGEVIESWGDFVNQAYELAEANLISDDELLFDDYGDEDGDWVAYVYDPDTGEDIDVLTAKVTEEAGRDTEWDEYTLDGGENYRELLFKMPGSTYSNGAMSAHWGDTKGVLAHARVQDFDTENGKMLFIEEIQSDWHNEGQSKGYADPKAAENADKEYRVLEKQLKEDRKELTKHLVNFYEFIGYSDPQKAAENDLSWHPQRDERLFKRMRESSSMPSNLMDSVDEYQEGLEKLRTLNRKRSTLAVGVPDAPFAKNYHEYVLKRLIREAAENGYDSIGWTTADIQSERWSEEYAEGYRIEYDQDIPKFLNKYGKKWGAKVGQTELENGETVWSMPITPAMKQSVLHEGQPLYSDRDTETVSNRDLLVNALDSAAQNTVERKRLQDYRSKIAEINAEEAKLTALRKEIQQLSFAEGKRDTARIKMLRDEATKAANRISVHDQQLLKLEASAPIRNLLNRERAAAAKAGEARGRKALDEYRTSVIAKQADDLRQIRALNETVRGLKDDTRIMEREFIRLAREYEKKAAASDRASGKSTAKISDLRAALMAEAKAHKADQKIWEREFNRLLREYEYNDRRIDRLEQTIARQRLAAKEKVQSRNRTEMRHKILRVVKELNDYLLKGTKEKHVMLGLQKVVAEALDIVNMDTVGEADRIAVLQDKLLKAKTAEEAEKIAKTIERIREQGGRMTDRLNGLKAAYAEIKNSTDPLIANAYDDVIAEKIESVSNIVGDTALRNMNMEQLQEVYELYKMVLTTIRDSNKAFRAAKGESIAIMANNVMREVYDVGGKKKMRPKWLDGISRFGWNNLKPIYAFKAIGSKTFTRIFDNVRAGEDVWARDVSEARAFYREQAKKYHYDRWNFEQQYTFSSSSEMDFDLNLEQIMSLYAYSKREQAIDHLLRGGIVFDETTEITVKTKLGIPVTFNPTEATAYNISAETLSAIINKLTPEQKAFVDSMQEYLSTVMGGKGNEVSREMYGVNLFKEKFYFPLRSASQYMAKVKEQQQGGVKIKNAGFSKATVNHANNPIVLSPFMDVWAGHVNDMSMYHAFVLPLEDFYRVYNYKTPTDETMATESVEMYIQNAFGKGATKYIDQLLTDLNGGARSDPTAGIINKMIGKFKKGAVFASLSVVIQQPSAIARAAALIDTKYFAGPKMDSKRHDALWAEVKKYAPVAIIKEMGYFDTNMGVSTKDYIRGKEYSSHEEKMKALFTDSAYRDEALSKAPALADEYSWCLIWEAVKRETKAKNPAMKVNSEEFLTASGNRFTEIIVATQVYDSVLSRSANMRSKDTGMKMATAFLAEPTTTINMVSDALIQGRRGDKKYARAAIGAAIASQIINSVLVSFVYAGRDDDEDKTYVEKYIGTLVGEVLDSLNPLTYIPFIKDIVSIVQGYEVERSDMAVVSDLWNAYQRLGSDSTSAYRKVEGFAGSIAQLFGLPLKNIMRDARAIYQTTMSFANGEKTTGAGIGASIKEAVTRHSVSDQQQLYEAIISGDSAHASRVSARYEDQSAVDSALVKALRENDPRILAAATARYNGDITEYTRIAKDIIAEGHFKQDLVVRAVNAEINSMKPDVETSASAPKGKALYSADDFAAALAEGDTAMANAIRTEIVRNNVSNGKTQQDAEKAFSGTASGVIRDMFDAGQIDSDETVDALVEYTGRDKYSAEDLVGRWGFELEHGVQYSDRIDEYIVGNITRSEVIEGIMAATGKNYNDAEKAFRSDVRSWCKDAFESGSISAYEAEMILMDDADDDDARTTVEYWEFAKNNPDISVDDSWFASYHAEVESSGIDLDTYIRYRAEVKSITGNGKKQRRMQVINSLPISPAQKDALYFAEGWAASTIGEAPWR